MLIYAVEFSNENPGSLRVRVGSDVSNYGGQLLPVRRVYIHDQFNNTIIDYNFSLIELELPIVFDESKEAAELPEQNEEIDDGTDAILTGWGFTMVHI